MAKCSTCTLKYDAWSVEVSAIYTLSQELMEEKQGRSIVVSGTVGYGSNLYGSG